MLSDFRQRSARPFIAHQVIARQIEEGLGEEVEDRVGRQGTQVADHAGGGAYLPVPAGAGQARRCVAIARLRRFTWAGPRRAEARAPPHAGNTSKPSPRPFERTRSSVLRMRRSGSACRRSRALARCSASSVRTGSTGNGPSARSATSRDSSRIAQPAPAWAKDVQHGGTAHLVEQLLGDGAPAHPSRLDEGQPRADDLGRITEEPMSLVPAGLLERPAEYCAAYGVEGHRSARSASSSV